MRDWMIFTDLDGTMLNHYDYRMDAARDAARQCEQQGIPVILNTSKTFAETLIIRDQLGLTSPFIVENGSAIYIPTGFCGELEAQEQHQGFTSIVCGMPVKEISRVMETLDIAPENYTRLSHCTTDEVVALTGLTPEQAQQATMREYSEPLIWHGDEARLAQLKKALQQHGLITLQGGRFLHVLGQCDKGIASSKLTALCPGKPRVIAIGDSPNDAAMLTIADIAIIVTSPSSDQLARMVDADYQTKSQAPEGWAEAITTIFQRSDFNEDDR